MTIYEYTLASESMRESWVITTQVYNVFIRHAAGDFNNATLQMEMRVRNPADLIKFKANSPAGFDFTQSTVESIGNPPASRILLRRLTGLMERQEYLALFRGKVEAKLRAKALEKKNEEDKQLRKLLRADDKGMLSPITSALKAASTVLSDDVVDVGVKKPVEQSDGDEKQSEADLKAVAAKLEKEKQEARTQCMAAEAAIDEEEMCLSSL
jgi:hypothetical protein